MEEKFFLVRTNPHKKKHFFMWFSNMRLIIVDYLFRQRPLFNYFYSVGHSMQQTQRIHALYFGDWKKCFKTHACAICARLLHTQTTK